MISLFLSLALAASNPADAPAAPATTEAAPAKEKVKAAKICRNDYRQTASRMRKRVCLTEAEWAVTDQGKSAGDLKTMGAR